MDDAVILQDVLKRYGAFVAVDRLSLRVPENSIYGFLGPNGAGKTTTIRMIMSILHPDAGELRVLGAERALEVKDRIGYLPEERGLYRKMTVNATLEYFGGLKGLRPAALRERIAAGLERIGLQDWRLKRVEALSKGMAQKIQILTAILHQPELVILDEPFSGLDPLNVELIKQLILELKQAGATIILSTHQMELAQRLCDRIVLINRGRAVIEGAPRDVRATFATRTVVLEAAGDLAILGALPGVVRRHIAGGRAELELADGVDPMTILRAAADLRVSHFSVEQPDLHQVFVHLVGQDPGDTGAAA